MAVAAHRADTDAQAVDYGRIVAAAENFVGFRAAFPFFFGLAVAQIHVNPRNQAAGERYAEVGFRIVFAAQDGFVVVQPLGKGVLGNKRRDIDADGIGGNG